MGYTEVTACDTDDDKQCESQQINLFFERKTQKYVDVINNNFLDITKY